MTSFITKKTIVLFTLAVVSIALACGDTSMAADPNACPAACSNVQGPTGPAGATGPQGPTGLISKSHLYIVTGPDMPFSNNGPYPKTINTQVYCKDVADVAVSGGFDYSGPAYTWAKCMPINVADVTKVSGWNCDVGAGQDGLGHGWVVCAAP